MAANNVCEIVFDGTKFYWRTRNTVDVVIVRHKDCKTYEVIIYEPTLDNEAPRIYLNEDILMSKVDHNAIDSKLSFAKRNSVPLTEKFVSGIVNKSVSDFVLNRLVIKDLVASEKIFLVDFRIDENEILIRPDFSELICARSEALRPHQTKHFKHLMQSAVEEALQALEEEKRRLQETCEAAAEMSTRVSPVVRERWRMPIVVNKVLRGARLCISDNEIFEKIQSNMKDDESVARMHAAMRSTGSSQPTALSPQRPTLVKEKSFATRTVPLSREVSFSRRAQGGVEAHGQAPLGKEQSCKKLPHGAPELPHAPIQRELSITGRCSADANSPTSKEVGTLKKNASMARFDTVSSRGKVNTEEFQHSAASTKNPATKRKKSKAVPKTPRRSSTNEPSSSQEDSGEFQTQLSDSGDHDDANLSALERVAAGFSKLSASIRSSFKYGTMTNIEKIEEGCERSTSVHGLKTSVPIAQTAPSRQGGDGTTTGSCGALETELYAPAVQDKPRGKSGSYLGSFLLALTGGEAPTPASPSHRGSAFGAALASLISSNKVLPAQ